MVRLVEDRMLNPDTTRVEYWGIDPNGVRRVWASGKQECGEQIVAYVAQRPDTGPVDRWQIVAGV